MNLIVVNPVGILVSIVIFGILIFVWLRFRRLTKSYANYTEQRGEMTNEISELKDEIKILNEKLNKFQKS
ncbi:hypothetical protein [Halpernia sp. GG3]